MDLVPLACDRCGADIEVPGDAHFVTCRYCEAKLEVQRTDGAAFTRVRAAVERVERKAQAIEREVQTLRAENRALALRKDIDDLDRAWNELEKTLMTRAKDGTLTVPTTGGAFVIGALAVVVGLFVAAGLRASEGPLVGLVVAVVGVGLAVLQHGKATKYQRARADHLGRRDELEQRLKKAERRAHRSASPTEE